MDVASLGHSFFSLLIVVPPFLVAIAVHEFSHAWAATYFGDPTPGRMGRLTLNPMAHIDPMGLLCLLVFRFGWAKPVQFDQRYFANPQRDRILTALAGPVSNMTIAWLSLVAMKYVSFGPYMGSTFQLMAWINVMLGVFNLMPVPPLDGGHVVEVMLERTLPEVASWVRRYSLLILIAVLYLPFTRMALVRAIGAVQHALSLLVP